MVKKGDTLWSMEGVKVGGETVWSAKAREVVRVDSDKNNMFFFANGWGASQNSLGRSYFRTKEEAEKDFNAKRRPETSMDKCKGCWHYVRVGCGTRQGTTGKEHFDIYGCGQKNVSKMGRGESLH